MVMLNSVASPLLLTLVRNCLGTDIWKTSIHPSIHQVTVFQTYFSPATVSPVDPGVLPGQTQNIISPEGFRTTPGFHPSAQEASY